MSDYSRRLAVVLCLILLHFLLCHFLSSNMNGFFDRLVPSADFLGCSSKFWFSLVKQNLYLLLKVNLILKLWLVYLDFRKIIELLKFWGHCHL